MNISDLSNEKLLADTQRLIDARRHQLDYHLLTHAGSDEFQMNDCCDLQAPMTFSPRVQAMVDECQTRGLELNLTR